MFKHRLVLSDDDEINFLKTRVTSRRTVTATRRSVLVQTSALRSLVSRRYTGALKTREWKTWYEIAWAINAHVENQSSDQTSFIHSFISLLQQMSNAFSVTYD